ncbi:MAG: hypothetical protein QM811_05380 [Pirellulales bacterium]
MTGWVGPGTSLPISRITIGALADLGYSVNYAAADAYSVSGTSSIVASAAASSSGSTASARVATATSSDSSRATFFRASAMRPRPAAWFSDLLGHRPPPNPRWVACSRAGIGPNIQPNDVSF